MLMTLPTSLSCRHGQAAWLALFALFPAGPAGAADGRQWSLADTGIVLLGMAGLAGLAACAWSRWRQRSGGRETTRVSQQASSLIEHADCLLWEAEVALGAGDWKWSFTLHSSALSQRLFGGQAPPPGFGLWRKFNSPEQAEMDRRSREAMLAQRPGYEQQFRITDNERVLWLNESVSITPTGPDRYRLVGLVTDITAQRLAEQAAKAREEQVQQLMARANCMLWQAKVECDDQGVFHWEWFVPQSELYRRMAGEDSAPKAIMPWGQLNVPEYEEIERRSRQAMRQGLPDYEQEFRVIKDGKTMWMHEQVSITHLSPRSWKLEGVVIDTTAQRQAEEARRTSDAQLGKLLEVADCMVWEAVVTRTPDDTLQWSQFMPRSALYQRIFGDTKKVELNWHILNVPELEEMTARSLEAVKNRSPGYMQEFRVILPSEVIWLREIVTLGQLAADQFRMVGVITDISALRAAEEARRKSAEHLRELLFRADCLLWEATVEMLPAGWNWKLEIQPSGLGEKLSGRPEPEALERLWERFNIPEWSEMNDRCRTALTEGWLGYEQIFHIIREDGSLLWIQETVTIKQLSSWRYSLVGVATDITRQRGTEAALAREKERLAVTLRAMAEGVITTDVDGRVQYMNPAAAALTRWNEAAIGLPVEEICILKNDRTDEAVAVPVAHVARGNLVAQLPAQTRLVTRDGERRLVEGCCAPIHSPDSRVNGMVLVFRDVTEHERLEQELVRATRLESVGILAGGIAHDFNNILTGLMGNLTLAQFANRANPELGERLRDAEKATLRARDLTQQLLTFAKGGDPVRVEVHLETVLQDTTAFALHGSNVKAIYDIAPDLWAADADKGQIGRVIQNLVINAVQAMPAGGMLRLTARNEQLAGPIHPGLEPGDYVHLAIADTGEGIRPEHLSRIFDPYFTTKQTGTGLGLAAVYSIIKKLTRSQPLSVM